MPDSIPTQLALLVVERLKTVRKANGYAFDIGNVHRPKRKDTESKLDRFTSVELVDILQEADENDLQGVKKTRTTVFSITHYTETDEDPTPLQDVQTTAISELERALAQAFDGSGLAAFGGVGKNATLEAPELFENDDVAGVRINLLITYSHSELDPYTPI